MKLLRQVQPGLNNSMKAKKITPLFIICIIISSCTRIASWRKTNVVVVQPQEGIFVHSNFNSIQLPTEGYQVYLIGEIHGMNETYQFTLDYLESLHKKGIRDIILEESIGKESAALDYINGLSDGLDPGLCLRADILDGIRHFNKGFSPNERITVHLVDLDYTPLGIYTHIRSIRDNHQKPGHEFPLPSKSDFTKLSKHGKLELVYKLEGKLKINHSISNEVETIKDSIKWIHLTSGGYLGPYVTPQELTIPEEAVLLREDRLAQNIIHLLEQENHRPVLAIFGAKHARKSTLRENTKWISWATQLSEEDINIYSLFVAGMQGTAYWRGETHDQGIQAKDIYLPPNTTLASLLSEHIEYKVVHIDFRSDKINTVFIKSDWISGENVSELYDGIILFRKFSPMSTSCP